MEPVSELSCHFLKCLTCILRLVFGNADGLGGPSDPDFFLPINADLDAELETESTVLALQAAHRARREERLAKQAARAKAKATTPEATTSVTVTT